MSKTMLIDAAHAEETRVAIVDGRQVEEFDFESRARRQLRGNIYLAKVTRVEPSLQAAFVEYGGNRHGFLAFNEIHPDYYQIPVSDRRLLQEAEEEEAELAAQLDLGQRGDEEADDGFGPDGAEITEDDESPEVLDAGAEAEPSPGVEETQAETEAGPEAGADGDAERPEEPAAEPEAAPEKEPARQQPRRAELLERYKDAR